MVGMVVFLRMYPSLFISDRRPRIEEGGELREVDRLWIDCFDCLSSDSICCFLFIIIVLFWDLYDLWFFVGRGL